MQTEKVAPFRFMRPMSLICTLSALLLGVAQATVMYMYFDPGTFMYDPGAELALGALYALYAAVTVATVVFCVIFRRRGYSLSPTFTYTEGEKTRVELSIVRWLSGAVFAGGAIVRLAAFVLGKSKFALPAPVAFIMLVFYVVASLYFFPELDKTLGTKIVTAVCGMLGAVALAIDALAAYVDMSIPIAADYRGITVACTIFFLLFIVSELRMKIAEPKPWTYLAFLCISGSFCGANFIGRAVFGLGLAPAVTDNGARTVCFLALTLYILSRLADPRIEHISELNNVESKDSENCGLVEGEESDNG